MINKNYLINDVNDYDYLIDNLNLSPNKKIIIFLKGELGSGKTTFIKQVLNRVYRFHQVTSPTFGIINSYNISDNIIYHYDLYRINDDSELLEIGLYDTLEINTLHFIEWPEIIPNNIINPDIIITFMQTGKQRIISIDTKNG